MPEPGQTAIGTARLPGQDPLDLSVCMAILKKAIVFIPVVIMIILYIIRASTPDNNANPDTPVNNVNLVAVVNMNLTDIDNSTSIKSSEPNIDSGEDISDLKSDPESNSSSGFVRRRRRRSKIIDSILRSPKSYSGR